MALRTIDQQTKDLESLDPLDGGVAPWEYGKDRQLERLKKRRGEWGGASLERAFPKETPAKAWDRWQAAARAHNTRGDAKGGRRG